MNTAAGIFVAMIAAAATLSASSPARACGPAQVRENVRENVRNVGELESDEVSALFAEAARLDTRARQMDMSASALERTQETLLARARELRQEARGAGELEEARLLARAEQMSAQAAQARASALEKRAQAVELRISARETRQRADRLVGGGRWRRSGAGVPTRAI